LREPPLPWTARAPYALIAAGGVALLPAWARDELEIDSRLPRWAGERGGALATKAVRWGLSAALPEYPTL